MNKAITQDITNDQGTCDRMKAQFLEGSECYSQYLFNLP